MIRRKELDNEGHTRTYRYTFKHQTRVREVMLMSNDRNSDMQRVSRANECID
jgi:hypothetical protein